MKRWFPTLAALFLMAAPVHADYAPAVAAYKRGDYATALKEFTKLAEQGDARAQFELGLMYFNGQGVTQDYAQAVKRWRKAAKQGLVSAQYNLAVMYDTGRGVTRNYAEARKWYRKAAEQGLVSAQYNLGLIYFNGQGVTKNHVQAAKWFQMAAEQGHARAQFTLGVMYDNALYYARALKWYRKAAEQGHARAQYNLGLYYLLGEGMAKEDYVKAHLWFDLAASRSTGKRKKLYLESRDRVEEKMTSQQIAESQRLARKWKPKKAKTGK